METSEPGPARAEEPRDGSARAPRRTESGGSTRTRILDIALELFIERGYEATSLRDIAERLGTTKAALYYHFERKEDILLELHLRLHAIGSGALEQLGSFDDGQRYVEAWPAFTDYVIDQVIANRDLILMHQRNRNALEGLMDNERHRAANDEFEEQFRRILQSPDISIEQRVRMACSISAVVGVLASGDALFGEVPMAELAELVRTAVHDVLTALGPTAGAPR